MRDKEELRLKANSLCSAVIKDKDITATQREELLSMCNAFFRRLTNGDMPVERLTDYLEKIRLTYREIKQGSIVSQT